MPPVVSNPSVPRTQARPPSVISSAESEHVGYLFATTEEMPSDPLGPGEQDPWDGEAVAFVVFSGSHPGLYTTW